MKEGNDIDKLFKEGLESPDLPFNDLDWEALEERLHPNQKRRIIPLFWLSGIAGVAAILLVIFSVIRPGEIPKLGQQAKKMPKHILEYRTSGEKSAISSVIGEHVNKEHPIVKNANSKSEVVRKVQELETSEMLGDISGLVTEADTSGWSLNYEDKKTVTAAALSKVEAPELKIAKRNPNFSLGISVAPDLTSVQKSGKSSLSGGIGIEAALKLNKRLSIATGIIYAKKIYESNFDLYRPNTNYQFKNQPLNVHANCDVLEIPINFNYKVLGNEQNSLSLTTGLSSYLMLKERYSYTYQPGYASGPQSYEVKNQNQHFFGIANIGITFQRRINSKAGINVTPFVKLPLTNIGYGRSRLSSAGIAVSVNMLDIFNKK